MDQLCSLLLNDIVREHNRFYPIQIKRTLKYSCGMRGKTDMTNLACFFCLHKRLQSTALTDYLIKLFHARIMYLIKINIICAEIFQTGFYIICHCFFRSCHGLCCKHKFFTDSFQSISDILLTDCISSCRINIVESLLHHCMKKLSCSFLIDLLDRNTSKSHT